MSRQRAKIAQISNTVVEDPSLLDSDSAENEETAPPKPINWSATLAKIKNDPSSMSSIMVVGERKLNGIYKCIGVKNQRPYFRKNNADFVIWYDESEDIWSLTDSAALTLSDPELYGYIDSMAWDVTKISKAKNWHLADVNGKWIPKRKMEILKVESGRSVLNSLLSNTIPESRQAAQAAVEQPVSLMSSFWADFKKMKINVKENRNSITELKTNQEGVKQKQREILVRLEKLEKERNSDKYNDLIKKIEQVEGQVKILSKSKMNNNKKRKKSRVDDPSVEELIRDNNLEKASYNAMMVYLKKKRKQRVLLSGKVITASGSKRDLRERIRKLNEKPEVNPPKSDDEETDSDEIGKIDEFEKRTQLRKARELRALARQKKKEQLERPNLVRQRGPASPTERISKKMKKYKDNETNDKSV